MKVEQTLSISGKTMVGGRRSVEELKSMLWSQKIFDESQMVSGMSVKSVYEVMGVGSSCQTSCLHEGSLKGRMISEGMCTDGRAKVLRERNSRAEFLWNRAN